MFIANISTCVNFMTITKHLQVYASYLVGRLQYTRNSNINIILKNTSSYLLAKNSAEERGRYE